MPPITMPIARIKVRKNQNGSVLSSLVLSVVNKAIEHGNTPSAERTTTVRFNRREVCNSKQISLTKLGGLPMGGSFSVGWQPGGGKSARQPVVGLSNWGLIDLIVQPPNFRLRDNLLFINKVRSMPIRVPD